MNFRNLYIRYTNYRLVLPLGTFRIKTVRIGHGYAVWLGMTWLHTELISTCADLRFFSCSRNSTWTRALSHHAHDGHHQIRPHRRDCEPLYIRRRCSPFRSVHLPSQGTPPQQSHQRYLNPKSLTKNNRESSTSPTQNHSGDRPSRKPTQPPPSVWE